MNAASKNRSKMSKQLVSALLVFALFVSLIPLQGITNTVYVNAATVTLKEGDYVQFGKYNDTPILWRVIHKGADGNPILWSDRILTLKAFDVHGNYHAGNIVRNAAGSNYYPDSNIRQWLNSNSANSGSNLIDWIQNDPEAGNTDYGKNGYHTEKGFLAAGNFSAEEYGIIKPFTHKVLLDKADAAKADGGTEAPSFSSKIDTVAGYYEQATTYYKNIEDRVFLLSVKQLKDWVLSNSAVLGEAYYEAKPTSQAVKQSVFQDASFSSENNWLYWFNTADANSGRDVYYYSGDAEVNSASADIDIYGVRPALQLNASNPNLSIASEGTGTVASPYIVSAVLKDTQSPTAPTSLTATNVRTTSLTLGWNASTDNVGVSGYEVYRGSTLLRTVAANINSFSVTGLSPGVSYTFTVRALDAAKNKSNASNLLQVRTIGTMDVVGKQISINGKTLNLGAGIEPVTINGSIMVPFRPVFEALGLTVSYNAKTKAIEGSRSGYRLSLVLNSRAATVNGKSNKTVPVAPTVIKGSTMVPLRFVGEELGLVVTFRSK